MGFGFRVGVPGMRVRVSTRGVRASVGPRIARVSVGSGRTRLSGGLGPVYASTGLGGGRRGRRRTAHRTTPRQLEQAARAQERAEEQARREQVIEELRGQRQDMTTAHLQHFAPLRPPVIPAPPVLTPAWARAQARRHHRQHLPLFARAERAAARERAAAEAPEYLAAEQGRLAREHARLQAEADAWWQALLRNDEPCVLEAVNLALADNDAPACALGVDAGALSVVMRQLDLDQIPEHGPAVTPAGRPTLKKLSQRDRMLWWYTALGSHLVATLKECFATAPGIDTVNLAVLTRIPSTMRLGVIVYGQWTRPALADVQWRDAEDALRFPDIAVEIHTGVHTTRSGTFSTQLKALDEKRLPGLALLMSSIDESAESAESAEPDDPAQSLTALDRAAHETPPAPDPAQPSPYATLPFATWRHFHGASPAGVTPADAEAVPDPTTTLTPGQNTPVPESATSGLNAVFTRSASSVETDLVALLLDADGKVTQDGDFVFYNQPADPYGAVRLFPATEESAVLVDQVTVQLSALPPEIRTVLIGAATTFDSSDSFTDVHQAVLEITSADGTGWRFPLADGSGLRVVTLAELYRHGPQDSEHWKLRALGQGWADGLAGLARSHGVDLG